MLPTVDLLQVSVAVPSEEVGATVAETLLRARLAACVQVLGPMTSRYWWDGEIESAQELLVLAKTRGDLLVRVIDAVRSVHPYDVPEILATPVTGDAAYLRWVTEETTS
jgi:periplasmic divalent cation tolerance protein